MRVRRNIQIFLDIKTDIAIQDEAEATGVSMEKIAENACNEILDVDPILLPAIPQQCREGTRYANRIYPIQIYPGKDLYEKLIARATLENLPLGRLCYFACWYHAQTLKQEN